jgi:hypothetical protein
MSSFPHRPLRRGQASRQLLDFAAAESLAVADKIRGLMRYLRLSYEGRLSELDSSVFDRLGRFVADDMSADLPFKFDSETSWRS